MLMTARTNQSPLNQAIDAHGRCVPSWPEPEGGGKGGGWERRERNGLSSQPTFLHPREQGCKLKSRLRKEPREKRELASFTSTIRAAAANESRFSRTPGHIRVERHQKTSALPYTHPLSLPLSSGEGVGLNLQTWGTSRSASPTPSFRGGRVPQAHGHSYPLSQDPGGCFSVRLPLAFLRRPLVAEVQTWLLPAPPALLITPLLRASFHAAAC